MLLALVYLTEAYWHGNTYFVFTVVLLTYYACFFNNAPLLCLQPHDYIFALDSVQLDSENIHMDSLGMLWAQKLWVGTVPTPEPNNARIAILLYYYMRNQAQVYN